MEKEQEIIDTEKDKEQPLTHESKKKRKRQTPKAAQLRDILSKNLNAYIAHQKGISQGLSSQSKIAEETGFSNATVGRWFRAETLPQLDQAYVLAEALNMTIDELVSEAPNGSSAPFSYSYADAFDFIYFLMETGVLNREHISDPILRFLIRERQRIDSLENLDKSKRSAWHNKVRHDFNIPMFDQGDRAILDDYFNEFFSSCTEISEYDSYVDVLKMMDAFRRDLQEWRRATERPHTAPLPEPGTIPQAETDHMPEPNAIYGERNAEDYINADHQYSDDDSGDFRQTVLGWIRSYDASRDSKYNADSR